MATKQKPKPKGKKRFIRPVSLDYKTNVQVNKMMKQKALENFSEFIRLLINNETTKNND